MQPKILSYFIFCFIFTGKIFSSQDEAEYINENVLSKENPKSEHDKKSCFLCEEGLCASKVSTELKCKEGDDTLYASNKNPNQAISSEEMVSNPDKNTKSESKEEMRVMFPASESNFSDLKSEIIEEKSETKKKTENYDSDEISASNPEVESREKREEKTKDPVAAISDDSSNSNDNSDTREEKKEPVNPLCSAQCDSYCNSETSKSEEETKKIESTIEIVDVKKNVVSKVTNEISQENIDQVDTSEEYDLSRTTSLRLGYIDF
ncbi:hypothetical protein CWI36_1804p0020 [Hamiltosporidium magnivora]|uniref:Uncharacterized protein n=1 Tax=Hamiltosporidium magnivora TaxID=148818 RepID=A0A4Q9KY80_9MICR|nr:hypothetical protein CWI36_1804p0020 [Hamiltosporidium magnivora]